MIKKYAIRRGAGGNNPTLCRVHFGGLLGRVGCVWHIFGGTMMAHGALTYNSLDLFLAFEAIS